MEPNAQQELAFIKKIMEDCRRISYNYGKFFIVPGILFTLATFADFTINIKGFSKVTIWIWVIAIIGGWLYIPWQIRRKRRKNRVSTLAGKLMSATWSSCSIAIGLLVAVGSITGALKAWTYQPLIALFLGVAFFISSKILNYNWLGLTALGWWIGAVALFIWPSIYSQLIMGIMMVLFYLLPGMILYYRWKMEMDVKPGD